MEDFMKDYARSQFEQSLEIHDALLNDDAILETLAEVARASTSALRAGGKMLFAGNGGSAADAQHLAGELVSRFNYDRPGLCAVSLATDTSVITAIGNDYGYERLFSRQVEALGKRGDVLVAISTSGRSKNILAGIRSARESGLITVGLTGKSGGEMAAACDYCLCAPADTTPRIQECHILIGHTLCAMIERAMFPQQ